MTDRGEYATLETGPTTHLVGRNQANLEEELKLALAGGVPEYDNGTRPDPPDGPLIIFNTDTLRFEIWWPEPAPGLWLPLQEFPVYFAGGRNAEVTTSLTVINQFEICEGVLTPSGLEVGFTLAHIGGSLNKPQWTYTGPNRGPTRIEALCAVEKTGSGNPVAYELQWHRNGAPFGTSSFMYGRQNEPSMLYSVTFMALNTNDVIDFRGRQVGGTENFNTSFMQQFAVTVL